MIIVFLGSPGVGKGTQAGLLCAAKGWRHVSTGELLRSAVERGTVLGDRVRTYLDDGKLVPDDLMLALVEETVGGDAQGVVLDGFPRTQVQAEGLDAMLGRHGKGVDRVILLSAAEEEVVRRMLARGRDDDSPDTVRTRLAVYHRETEPLVEYYRSRGLLNEVDGVGEIPAIHRRVMAALS